MTRWEYHRVQTTHEDVPQELYRLGQDGLECFQVTEDGPWVYLWLKRPLPDAAPRGLTGRLAAAGYRSGESAE